MRLIPVLDIQDRLVVRGIGGRRAEYRPLTSCLTPATDPVEVSSSLLQVFQPCELYVADLDAIAGKRPSWPLLTAGIDQRVDWWIDAGIRTVNDARTLAEANVAGIVLGLETIDGPEVLDAVAAKYGAGRIVFSLDLRGGRLLGAWSKWPAQNESDWLAVAARAVATGITRGILLDLERVGEGRGTGTEAMCRTLASRFPDVEWICGGGVRDLEDLRRLQECGAAGALVASALHDGRIKPEDWPRAAAPAARRAPGQARPEST